jgi:hypothetical protein
MLCIVEWKKVIVMLGGRERKVHEEGKTFHFYFLLILIFFLYFYRSLRLISRNRKFK